MELDTVSWLPASHHGSLLPCQQQCWVTLRLQSSKAVFYAKDDDHCPCQAFIDALKTDIQTWLDLGDQLVVAADINEPVGSSSLTSVFQDLGLHEMFRHNHSGRTPPTYNHGSETIDAIFVTSSLLGLRSGYLAFGDAIPSDHRAHSVHGGIWS